LIFINQMIEILTFFAIFRNRLMFVVSSSRNMSWRFFDQFLQKSKMCRNVCLECSQKQLDVNIVNTRRKKNNQSILYVSFSYESLKSFQIWLSFCAVSFFLTWCSSSTFRKFCVDFLFNMRFTCFFILSEKIWWEFCSKKRRFFFRLQTTCYVLFAIIWFFAWWTFFQLFDVVVLAFRINDV
jgi:hypothetical protein